LIVALKIHNAELQVEYNFSTTDNRLLCFPEKWCAFLCTTVYNAIFFLPIWYISSYNHVGSDLLLGGTEVWVKKHRSAASHWQTFLVHLVTGENRTHRCSGDRYINVDAG
jgi:hypothetical protein